MGNALRFLCGNCFNPIDHQEYESLGDHHGFSTDTVGVSALAHDLFQFDITSQVPERLSGHVASSLEARATWYNKLLLAWKEANPPPKTPEQTSKLVIQTLELAYDVEGLLKFYGLPIPRDRVEVPGVVVFPPPPPPPEQVKYVLQIVCGGITAGDCLTVYLDVADTTEAPNVPKVVQIAVSERLKARAFKDYAKADALYKKIVDSDYRLLRGANNVEILAKRFRIRLRGIDAPEDKMHYGKEAEEELINLVQGKCLTIGMEVMLKKGCAWHCAAFDNRPELTKWEMEARAAGVGLWAVSNPEKPWEWRKKNPEMPWDWRIPIITKTTC
ncbi:hypothetical protein C5167_024963 [Papaver somniferum]|uniref:TNase-like domain-containing protein n=1 Tax=Papaver somniferum TaxID=3469 RepID=A0A4Y7JU34_PAPSO|nr:hypothetical protein C5167_024963 [Papaver somniferum]